jgi:hypothetical protein
MPFDDHGRVTIRSYRVVFRLERRIFEIDRFRLPFPYGVEVRALGYALATYLAVLALSSLPLIRIPLGLLPTPVHWGLLPLGVVFAMLKLRIDGRPPHKVLGAFVRWAAHPKHLAGLRACPPAGASFTPVRDVWMRPDWRGPRYRPAVITGPARVTLRYPATVEARRSLRDRAQRKRLTANQREVTARQLLVCEQADRPMFVGKTIDIPTGGEVVFK